jgi:hypothetical protein
MRREKERAAMGGEEGIGWDEREREIRERGRWWWGDDNFGHIWVWGFIWIAFELNFGGRVVF